MRKKGLKIANTLREVVDKIKEGVPISLTVDEVAREKTPNGPLHTRVRRIIQFSKDRTSPLHKNDS